LNGLSPDQRVDGDCFAGFNVPAIKVYTSPPMVTEITNRKQPGTFL